MITSHKQLAEQIAGKSILHMNSLGKDSVLALEWLVRSAAPAKIYSVFFSFLAAHPGDEPYLRYLKKRYPDVEFMSAPNSIELNLIAAGVYQSPLDVNYLYNHFEFEDFSRENHVAELKVKLECDYICSGFSKYEGFARAARFYKEGLMTKDHIYPLGLMSKKQVYQLLKSTGVKLHPCYKTSPGTYDHPSYWKMRRAMLARPQYRENLLKWYPLLELDFYRYEKLLKKT